jgi:hypothetical protein
MESRIAILILFGAGIVYAAPGALHALEKWIENGGVVVQGVLSPKMRPEKNFA